MLASCSKESVEVNGVVFPNSAQEDGTSSLNSASAVSRPTADALSSKYTFIMLLRSVSGPESVLATESSCVLPNIGPEYESTLSTGELVGITGLSSK